jgi:uncharacterized protein (DUF302 family)
MEMTNLVKQLNGYNKMNKNYGLIYRPGIFLFLFIISVTGTITMSAYNASASENTPAKQQFDYNNMRHFSTHGDFNEVLEFLKLAITDRGIKINNISHIGEMLARTAKDVGATKKIFINAQAIEFCSASLSRKMMEADATNIVFCPYIIFIYELPTQPETIHIAFRRLAGGPQKSGPVLEEVENLLEDIINDAIQ